MGYRMPNVVKEIYIPVITNESYSLQEFKEKTGLDLKSYVSLDENGKEIGVIWPKYTKIYLVYDGDNAANVPQVGQIAMINSTTWEEDVTDANLVLEQTDIQISQGYGISIRIPKDKAFNIDNVLITGVEI